MADVLETQVAENIGRAEDFAKLGTMEVLT